MSIRVKHNVLLQISRDTLEKKKQFFPDANEVILAAFDSQSNGTLAIPATTSLTLDFGEVTDVRGLYIEVSADVVVRINGSLTNLPITLASDATKGQLFLESNISAVIIENESATAITGVYALWGDPSA